MTFVTDLRKTVADATPVYAVVGVTDAAAEKLRDARHQAVAARKTITKIDAKDVQKNLQDAPGAVLERTLELAGKAQGQYDAYVARGEQLVKSIRNQKATQDLVSQAETTVALGKGAVTTVRKAVNDTQASAKATFTTGRHQAAKVADVVGGVVVREAKDARQQAEVIADATEQATAATTTAAKRTRTTARKGAKATATRTKAASTSVRKSAPRARKATKAAAGKVGA